MTEKRYNVHSMIAGMNIGESMDLKVLQELIEEYGASANIKLSITDNNKGMTYKEVADKLNECDKRNQLLKRIKDVNNLTERILSLEKQNGELMQQIIEIKKILLELNNLECFWDSAILQGVIDNISNVVGVDLDD